MNDELNTVLVIQYLGLKSLRAEIMDIIYKLHAQGNVNEKAELHRIRKKIEDLTEGVERTMINEQRQKKHKAVF